MMTLCDQDSQFFTGIINPLIRVIFSSSSTERNGAIGEQVAGGTPKMIDGKEMNMNMNMAVDDSVDNVLTMAFVLFLTVLIAFLGAGLVSLVLIMLMHSNPQPVDDQEKQEGIQDEMI